MSKVLITFAGGVGSVTGANFLLQVDDTKILIDCGLIQGSREADLKNREPFPYEPRDIDYLFVTHSHMDHIGRIPKLVREGFRGEIYSTPVTKEIATFMFADALSVMRIHEKERDLAPLYEQQDVDQALSQWKEIPYHESKTFGGFSVFARDAGHILGSAMLEFTLDIGGAQKKLVFTGDLGNSPSLLLRDTEKITDADYLVMESVYGDRNHENKDEREEKFAQIVKETIARNGTLVIPAFSLERTQMILYLLNNLMEDGHVPEVPVYLDSPLAIKITEVYGRVSKHFNDEVKKEILGGDDIFDFPTLKRTMKREESEKIAHIPGAKIVIAGSGMSEGGRVAYHEADFLPDPNNTLLLVGYQGVGTLGRKLIEGLKSVKIHKKEIKVRARIEEILGFSSHKDMDHLIEFVEHTKGTVKKVFVCMGETKSSTFLAQRLRDYVGVNAVVPEEGDVIELN